MTPEAFKEFQSRTGTTLRQAAEATDVDKSKLSRWLRGAAKLGRPEVKALERLVAKAEEARNGDEDGDADEIFEGALAASARVIAEAAKNGDMRAARLVVEQERGKARQREVREQLEEPLRDQEILDELTLIEERLVSERRGGGTFEGGGGI